MITTGQIKAARALLGWRQEDLAARSGISLTAINKLERELVLSRKFTLDVLQQTFERDGVEFTEGPGLRLTDNVFGQQTFTGKQAPIQLLDDIFAVMKEKGGEVLLSGIDESVWEDYREYVQLHQQRLKTHNIKWRAMLCEGDTDFLPGSAVKTCYRWIPESLFTQLLYYVYADRFALVLWGKPIRITIIRNKLVAESFRRQFEMNWKNGKVPK